MNIVYVTKTVTDVKEYDMMAYKKGTLILKPKKEN
jgi:hypothetical protein